MIIVCHYFTSITIIIIIIIIIIVIIIMPGRGEASAES